MSGGIVLELAAIVPSANDVALLIEYDSTDRNIPVGRCKTGLVQRCAHRGFIGGGDHSARVSMTEGVRVVPR